MNPSSLDTQSGSTQDDHLARIVRLETNMDNVTTVLVNLQRTQEQHFQYTLTRLDELRDRIDQAHANTQGEMNRLQDRIDQVHLHALERIERLQDRIDRNTRCLVGLMLANITAVAGLYVRMLLA